MYRVARFAARFDFKVEKNTILMMNELKGELNTLSKERVFTEFRKALNTKNPEKFFNVLKDANVLEVHFKEIYDLIGAEQPLKYHPEGDSYNHTMLALKNITKLTDDEVVRFCTLVHDLGKGTTPKDMYPHHYGHEKRGVEPLRNLSNRLGIPNEWYNSGKIAVLEHMRGGNFFELTPAKKVDFLTRVEKSKLGLSGLQMVVYADRYRGEGSIVSKDEYNFQKIGEEMISEIDGKYIEKKYRIKPGIEFGRKLREERIRWIRNREESKE